MKFITIPYVCGMFSSFKDLNKLFRESIKYKLVVVSLCMVLWVSYRTKDLIGNTVVTIPIFMFVNTKIQFVLIIYFYRHYSFISIIQNFELEDDSVI